MRKPFPGSGTEDVVEITLVRDLDWAIASATEDLQEEYLAKDEALAVDRLLRVFSFDVSAVNNFKLRLSKYPLNAHFELKRQSAASQQFKYCNGQLTGEGLLSKLFPEGLPPTIYVEVDTDSLRKLDGKFITTIRRKGVQDAVTTER